MIYFLSAAFVPSAFSIRGAFRALVDCRKLESSRLGVVRGAVVVGILGFVGHRLLVAGRAAGCAVLVGVQGSQGFDGLGVWVQGEAEWSFSQPFEVL